MLQFALTPHLNSEEPKEPLHAQDHPWDSIALQAFLQSQPGRTRVNKVVLTEGEPHKKAQVALTNASLEEVQGDALLLAEFFILN